MPFGFPSESASGGVSLQREFAELPDGRARGEEAAVRLSQLRGWRTFARCRR